MYSGEAPARYGREPVAQEPADGVGPRVDTEDLDLALVVGLEHADQRGGARAAGRREDELEGRQRHEGGSDDPAVDLEDLGVVAADVDGPREGDVADVVLADVVAVLLRR